MQNNTSKTSSRFPLTTITRPREQIDFLWVDESDRYEIPAHDLFHRFASSVLSVVLLFLKCLNRNSSVVFYFRAVLCILERGCSEVAVVARVDQS